MVLKRCTPVKNSAAPSSEALYRETNPTLTSNVDRVGKHIMFLSALCFMSMTQTDNSSKERGNIKQAVTDASIYCVVQRGVVLGAPIGFKKLLLPVLGA